jgi:anti-sigma factor RsiW
MMTCRELVEFLMAYLDDDLPPRQRRVFEEHLGLCPPCKNYLDTYRETIQLGKSLCPDPEGPVPDSVPEELVQAVLRARRQED